MYTCRILLWDHPRLCGEKSKLLLANFSIYGSPPPMRGKGQDFRFAFNTSRITPAYAGKSFAKQKKSCNGWDHPRLCGEKRLTPADRSAKQGSPPPMRGKAVDLMIGLRSVGITPAYAGKSLRSCHEGGKSPDHPRLCGEKSTPSATAAARRGSPPPMRGKVHEMLFCKLLNRITPAYAGKSL